MNDAAGFGLTIAVISVAGLVAVLSNRLSERIRIPAPAVFLIAAAAAAELVPELGRVPVLAVQRVVTVMLVLLLFDGGMHLGWRRFRRVGGAVLWIGVVGTLVTTLGVAALAYLVFGFGGLASLLLGVALAPTDPAVVFSVLGRREVTGRSGTVLEGESGANDPVGIAAMAALLATGTAGGWRAVGAGLGEFALEMLVGAAIGVGGGYALSVAMRRMALPSGALYPLRTLLGSGAIYGLATVAHGSGFLAVFVAGILVGDVRAPYKAEIERFHASLASLAEIVAFAMLGLTVSLTRLAHSDGWLIGLGLAVLLALVIRPVLVGPLLLAVRLSRGERLFVMWAGLKGAVPILLGTYLVSAGVAGADRMYQVVVVVVAFSVVVQGGLVPAVARRVGVAMRVVEPEPWALGMRFRDEPTGLRRHFVAAGSPADGSTLAGLALGQDAWISMISRAGTLVPVRGETTLRAGDEVLLLADPRTGHDPGHLFRGGPPRPDEQVKRSGSGRSADVRRQDGLPTGWSPQRLWRLSILLCFAVAVCDALTGPHLILIGLLIVGPCCALLTGQWVRTALTSGCALGLGMLLGVPDGIFATATQYAFLAAVAAVGISTTLSAAVIERRRWDR